jgi:hypothetical protein
VTFILVAFLITELTHTATVPSFSQKPPTINADSVNVTQTGTTNASIPTALRWKPWGNDVNLTISVSQNLSQGTETYRLEGKTGNDTAGIESQELNYTGGYVLVAVGDTIKSSRKNYIGNVNPYDFQITIGLQVKGKNGEYVLSLVNGHLEVEGWIGKRHIQLITPYSLELLNLRQILLSHGDEYVSLGKVIITVERNSKLSTMEFALKFYEDNSIESNIFRFI